MQKKKTERYIVTIIADISSEKVTRTVPKCTKKAAGWKDSIRKAR